MSPQEGIAEVAVVSPATGGHPQLEGRGGVIVGTQYGTPGPPQLDAYTKPTLRGASVSWTPPADHGASPISGYVVTATADDGSGIKSVYAYDGDATHQLIQGLKPGVSYTVSVIAQNNNGTGEPSGTTVLKPLDIVFPGPPSTLGADLASSTEYPGRPDSTGTAGGMGGDRVQLRPARRLQRRGPRHHGRDLMDDRGQRSDLRRQRQRTGGPLLEVRIRPGRQPLPPGQGRRGTEADQLHRAERPGVRSDAAGQGDAVRRRQPGGVVHGRLRRQAAQLALQRAQRHHHRDLPRRRRRRPAHLRRWAGRRPVLHFAGPPHVVFRDQGAEQPAPDRGRLPGQRHQRRAGRTDLPQ
ncbi:fibronectin type III domain-containing protein [Nonomuraea sp. NPDC049028]|uniref:fibronectin type III domain-containing protein n=1 Tax=Nonomuraea sp. NPDC049028 TaxID=3364348 RepID=UPI0037182C09